MTAPLFCKLPQTISVNGSQCKGHFTLIQRMLSGRRERLGKGFQKSQRGLFCPKTGQAWFGDQTQLGLFPSNAQDLIPVLVPSQGLVWQRGGALILLLLVKLLGEKMLQPVMKALSGPENLETRESFSQLSTGSRALPQEGVSASE